MAEIAIVTADGFDTEADFNMVKHLLRKPRYVIPDHLRQKIVDSAANVMDRTDDHKTVLAACNTLITMDKVNVDLVRIAMPKKVERKDVESMSQEDLMQAMKDVQKKLPQVIEYNNER